MQQKTESHYADQGIKIKECNFKHAPVKLYVNGMSTKIHTDLTFDHKHKNILGTCKQVTGSPVAICTYGDEKNLIFQKWAVGDSKKPLCPTVEVSFKTKNGTLVILDPRDEFGNGKHYWKHKAELVNKKEGVSMSINFRFVKGLREVGTLDGIPKNQNNKLVMRQTELQETKI